MSLDLASCATGFSALYGNIVVAYSPNTSLSCFPAAAVSCRDRPFSAGITANHDKTEVPTVNAADAAAGDNKLSRRQLDVLSLIVEGRSNKEIARALNLAEGTVKIHVAALFSKLGVHRRAAVAIAGAQFLSRAAPQPLKSERRTFSSRPRLAARSRDSAGSDIMATQDPKLRTRRYNGTGRAGLLGRP
jgi:DNA-binding CsgD family transcriptional regulator